MRKSRTLLQHIIISEIDNITYYKTVIANKPINRYCFYNVMPCVSAPSSGWFNPLRAKFFRGNTNIYLQFVSLLHIDITRVLKIVP